MHVHLDDARLRSKAQSYNARCPIQVTPLYENPEPLENYQRPDPSSMGDMRRARWKKYSCTSVTYDGPTEGYSGHLRSMRKRAILERKGQHTVYNYFYIAYGMD